MAHLLALVGMVFEIGVFVTSYMSVPWIFIAGLVGGFVAGHRSASEPTSGCWHGLLAGVISGLGIAIGTMMFQSVIGRGGNLNIAIGSTGFLAPSIGVPSIIAGGIGSAVPRRRISTL